MIYVTDYVLSKWIPNCLLFYLMTGKVMHMAFHIYMLLTMCLWSDELNIIHTSLSSLSRVQFHSSSCHVWWAFPTLSDTTGYTKMQFHTRSTPKYCIEVGWVGFIIAIAEFLPCMITKINCAIIQMLQSVVFNTYVSIPYHLLHIVCMWQLLCLENGSPY